MPNSSTRQLREHAFCAAYVQHYNGAKAAEQAGYAVRGAKQRASELLAREEIQADIAALAKGVAEKALVEKEEVLRELLVILRSDVRHFEVAATGALELAVGAPESAWRAVQSVKHRTVTSRSGSTKHTVEFRLWNKTDATRQLGEFLKLFTQKTEHVFPPGTTGVLAVPVAPDAKTWEQAASARQALLLQHRSLATPQPSHN